MKNIHKKTDFESSVSLSGNGKSSLSTLSCSARRTDMRRWLAEEFSAGSSPACSGEIAWAGQSGFIFRTRRMRVGVDLYLSDSLAIKYRDSLFPHTRMMQPPCMPADLASLDAVLSTHGHSDHMDPGTLGPLFRTSGFRAPLYICPRAEVSKAIECGVPAERMVGLDAGETFAVKSNEGTAACTIIALPAAHETLQRDAWGNMKFLGYVLDLGGLRWYHSGDCVPFEGLGKLLRELCVDIALLPVNGRDAYRTEHGIQGNFSASEAAALCSAAGIRFFIAHHFGMFDFNTVSVSEIERDLAAHGWEDGRNALIPRAGMVYTFSVSEGEGDD